MTDRPPPVTPLRLVVVVIDLAGGAGAFCRNLAAGLRRACPGEFETTLLTFRPVPAADAPEFDRVASLGSAVRRDWRRAAGVVADVRRLRRAMRDHPSDVILAVHNYANLLVPLAAPRRPTILSVHSHLSRQLDSSPFGGITAALARRRYRRHTVVAPSPGVADDLREDFGVRDAVVIPHGVDAARLRELAEAPVTDLPPPGSYLVACGTLTAAKDYPTLLRAYAAARKRGLREDLVVLGDGEERAPLDRLARSLDVAGAVRFLGHRDNPYPYLRHARLFVMSSVFEGFGLALLEAVTLGLPCVATDCPSGPADILGSGEFGVLVPPGETDRLAAAILELTASPERLAFFARQATIRADDFSLERMARQYRDLFRAAARGRDHGARDARV
jgi:glycosyltransferase involved in cell wall biosynthesis